MREIKDVLVGELVVRSRIVSDVFNGRGYIFMVRSSPARIGVILRGTLAFVAVGIAPRRCRGVDDVIDSEGRRGDSPIPLSCGGRLPFWACVGRDLIISAEA